MEQNTINDVSVIYVTAHRCVDRLKKKLYLRSGSQRHRHFVGFFNVPVQAPTRATLFIRLFRETAPFSHLLRHAGDTEDTFSTKPPGPHGDQSGKNISECLIIFDILGSMTIGYYTINQKRNDFMRHRSTP